MTGYCSRRPKRGMGKCEERAQAGHDVCGLNINFKSVEHQLFATPNILLQSETWLFRIFSSNNIKIQL